MVGRGVKDAGIGVVLARRPLTLLVPSHVATSLATNEAERVLVNGRDLGLPCIVRSPSAEHDELTVLRFGTRRLPNARAIQIPRRPPTIQPDDDVLLVTSEGGSGARVPGHVVGLRTVNEQEWMTIDTRVSPGASGSALLVDGKLAAICQGLVPSSEPHAGAATLIRLPRATLRELAKLRAPHGVLHRIVAVVGLLTAAAVLALLVVSSGPRALYVYGSGATDAATMKTQLTLAGLHVTTAQTAPRDLSRYRVVVAEVAAPPADAIRNYLLGGGGVVLIEATPYYLGVNETTDWFGATQYVNAGDCIYASIVADRPLGTTFVVGEPVARSSCAHGGPAAYTRLLENTVRIAEWADGTVFAFTHLFARGRVYYQAQFGGAYRGQDTWTLFRAGVRWAARLTK